MDKISTDTRHERHVHFPTNDYEEDRQIHLNLRSPPPPYEAKDDFLEELRLDLAIAEEGIWEIGVGTRAASGSTTNCPGDGHPLSCFTAAPAI